jgi:CheY-like chemotaxis protein
MTTGEKLAAPWTFVLNERARILVVDDDPILREFARVQLGSPSATIDTAGDGETALERLRAEAYDIVLLDIEMPRVDGLTLLARIRADDALRRLPVIMLTGHEDMASIDRAYQAGASAFATKPVNWRQLAYLIRYVMRANQLESDARRDGAADMPAARDCADVPASEGDVRAFLQSIVERSPTLAEQLLANGSPQWARTMRDVGRFVQLALAEHRAQPPLAAQAATPDDHTSPPTLGNRYARAS